MLEAKPLTFLWKYWNCLKWGETSIVVFRHHVPLHAILSTKWFFTNGTEPTQEQNVDWEKRRMLLIYIGLKALKFYSFPPPPLPPHFHCFPPPPRFNCSPRPPPSFPSSFFRKQFRKNVPRNCCIVWPLPKIFYSGLPADSYFEIYV